MDEAANQGDKAKPGAAAQRVSLFGGRRKSGAGNGNGAGNGKAPSKPPRRPRGFGLSGLSGLLTFVLVIGLLGVAVLVWSVVESRKPGPLAEDKIVVIEREDDAGTIGDQLERAGVVDSALWFSAMTMIDGSRSSLKRGEYAFKAGVSLRQVEAELIAHKVVQHKLTIPEGLTSDQVVERLRDDDVLAGEVKEPPREGSLLPDTYLFERGDTRQAELTRMAKAQAKLVDEIWAKRAPDLPIKSPGELVTLASIVEKETGKADERPRVAGVFVNRLQKHMRLQSDPTIVYGLVFGKGTLGHPITKAELDQATPYNTYNIDGLPPGPICNPGKAALEAAANPMRTKELYFVADGTGGHAFAETLDQHLKNVAHWRQIEQDAKDRLAPDAAPTPGPTPTPAKHGALDDVDPAIFGAVALGDAPVDSGPLAVRLGKLAENRKAAGALLGPAGALSATRAAGASLDTLGAVVTGVNDEPPTQAFPDDPAPDGPAQPVASVPLSAAALADQKARIARYVGAGSADPRVAGLDAPAGGPARPRAFDASEGTPFDPLRNKTYDLNYAHAVPTFETY
ncbi:MAG: endolytic transglycosylase MltG [Roseiarcus sp.]|jgi:UPF0755 protein